MAENSILPLPITCISANIVLDIYNTDKLYTTQLPVGKADARPSQLISTTSTAHDPVVEDNVQVIVDSS